MINDFPDISLILQKRTKFFPDNSSNSFREWIFPIKLKLNVHAFKKIRPHSTAQMIAYLNCSETILLQKPFCCYTYWVSMQSAFCMAAAEIADMLQSFSKNPMKQSNVFVSKQLNVFRLNCRIYIDVAVE